MITEIMHEDNKYDVLSKKDREHNRKLILKPKNNDYFAWVKEKYNLVNPRSDIRKALFIALIKKNIFVFF